MSIYSLDFETYSASNIKNVGAYRYACDPSTEILIFAISKDKANWTTHPNNPMRKES